jgi:hypothetical protein
VQQVLIGGAVTLAVAAIIAIVTLAFKNRDAYAKLAKVLVSFLFICAAGYAGYAVGTHDGGKSAIGQMEGGTPLSEIDTGMPGWPLFAMSVIFFALITLTWFPEYLGMTKKDSSAE